MDGVKYHFANCGKELVIETCDEMGRRHHQCNLGDDTNFRRHMYSSELSLGMGIMMIVRVYL